MSDKFPMTDQRKAVFLKTLAETGSVAAACRAASPHSEYGRAAKSTFNDLRRKDPEFAQAWDDAVSDALAEVESELMRRAMEPAKSPVTDRSGRVVGFREDRLSSDRLLLRIASRLDPEAWAERRRQDTHVTGEIQHNAHLMLKPADVLLLDEPDRAKLIELLETIEQRRNGDDPRRIEVADEA